MYNVFNHDFNVADIFDCNFRCKCTLHKPAKLLFNNPSLNQFNLKILSIVDTIWFWNLSIVKQNYGFAYKISKHNMTQI